MLKRYITKLGIMLALSMLLLFAFVGIISLVMKPVYYWTPPKDNNKYNETLRVVGDINYAPMTFVDHNGNYAGYDVELLYLLGEKLEMNI